MAVDSYIAEAEDFRKNFGIFREKNIVLYGIGRYTATLVPELKEFHLVGLMDKDASKIGMQMYGLPIISPEEAKRKADLIIINTSGSYWDIIYQRIESLGVDIYYRNGEKAGHKVTEKFQENAYWDKTIEKLIKVAAENEVISFDAFDTLWQRLIHDYKDVFEWLGKQSGTDFTAIRNRAVAKCRKNATLDEIYEQIISDNPIEKAVADKIRKMETELEEKLLRPRQIMVELARNLIREGKEVYLLSDMYLSKNFFQQQLQMYGIYLPDDHILISCETDQNKKDGSMWKTYAETVVCGRRALHIGDQLSGDDEMPGKYGIETFRVMSKNDLMVHSSVAGILPDVTSLYLSAVMGLVENRLFQNPFALSRTKGKVSVKDRKTFGYTMLGPVILTFLLWLRQECQEDRILYFLARDGYFLIKDYQEICKLAGIHKPGASYLYTSRLLATTAGTEDGADDLLQMPYSGRLKDYLKDRYDIDISADALYAEERVPQYTEDPEKLRSLLQPYRKQIDLKTSEIRENYNTYLEHHVTDEEPVFVDISYYGHTQEMLSRILGRKSRAYYFHADLAADNPCRHENFMAGCFQRKADPKAEKSNIHNKCLLLEGFLTAPYGMIRSVNPEGEPICAPARDNQKYFTDKKEINDGIIDLIRDFFSIWDISTGRVSEADRMCMDQWYGLFAGGACELGEEVKRSFYNDNALVHRESNRVME